MEMTKNKEKIGQEKLDSFMNNMEKRIRDYHHVLRVSPIGEGFEDMAHQAFVETGFNVEWDGTDHKSGADLFFKNDVHLPFEWAKKPLRSPSVKTNVKKQQDPVRSDISGERLGNLMMGEKKERALEEVLDFLHNGVNYNYYLLLTRRTRRGKDYERKALNGNGFEEYEVFIIPAEYFHQYLYPVNKWNHTEKEWKREIEEGFRLLISKSMSHQYWVSGAPYEDLRKFSLGDVKVRHSTFLNDKYAPEKIAERKIN